MNKELQQELKTKLTEFYQKSIKYGGAWKGSFWADERDDVCDVCDENNFPPLKVIENYMQSLEDFVRIINHNCVSIKDFLSEKRDECCEENKNKGKPT